MVTLLDGGMGRELQRIGAPFRQPEWSALAMIEAPELVAKVHERYVEAGAQVITTNAYALVPFHVGSRFETDGARLAALAGRTARDVADRAVGVRVAGCLPPALGSYIVEGYEPRRAHPILEVLVGEQAPFVDIWLLETQSATVEVEVAGDVLDSLGGRRLSRWVSFTLADELVGGEPLLRSGESVVDAVRAAEAIGAELVSFNCSPPEVMEPAVRLAASATPLPIGVYANAFVTGGGEAADSRPANEGLNEIRDDLDPAAYALWGQRWVDAGATMVGGCCGVGPEHVRALSASLSDG